MPISYLFDGPEKGPCVVLAHGAGAPMDSAFMAFFAETLGAAGVRIVRFEFPYMADRRRTGRQRPPDRAPVLLDTWDSVIADLGGPANLVIGGKSLGGRMASLLAARLETAGTPVRGIVCLGYPFHAPGRPVGPDRLGHMLTLGTPTLVCQGSRDAMGTREEVESYGLSSAVRVQFLEDGDHGFKPRAKSGLTEQDNWRKAAEAVGAFVENL